MRILLKYVYTFELFLRLNILMFLRHRIIVFDTQNYNISPRFYFFYFVVQTTICVSDEIKTYFCNCI